MWKGASRRKKERERERGERGGGRREMVFFREALLKGKDKYS
jgi:hypothetical protein